MGPVLYLDLLTFHTVRRRFHILWQTLPTDWTAFKAGRSQLLTLWFVVEQTRNQSKNSLIRLLSFGVSVFWKHGKKKKKKNNVLRL